VRALGFRSPAGVDEAGRGCLFGPVAAAAVILPERVRLPEVNDSKTIPEERRESLAAAIRQAAIAWSVAFATVEEIRKVNILQASRLAMKRAVEALEPKADYLLVDFLNVDCCLPQEGIVKGDAKCKSIAAASILAKVERDRILTEYDLQFPAYGLKRNKGYGTAEHVSALKQYGPTVLHRLEFAPIPDILAGRRQSELFHA
jgi:ribonuclease HII